MMSMPLSKTYHPLRQQPILDTYQANSRHRDRRARWRNAVKVMEMCAVHGISQSRIFLGCDDLLDFERHVGHRFYDKLQRRHVFFKPGLGNAWGMVDVVGVTYPANSVPVMATERMKEL
jgi:hypothetical protein